MTHVFIVNNTTFDIHLKYMFAATGTANNPDFLLNPKCNNIHHSRERNLLGLIADISRVKINDKILFYLQGDNSHSGTIFGIFTVKNNPFYCKNGYLNNELNKELQYRVFIEQDEVYPKGISEYAALDCLEDIKHPSEMCWSLIYRKLRGNRGCTMITDYEAQRLKRLIKNANENNNPITLTNVSDRFYYDIKKNCIAINQSNTMYQEDPQPILDIKERLLFKIENNQAYETHLQAYILQNIDINNNLRQLIIPNPNDSFWIGNEVGCGVGMQKIDILIMQFLDNTLYINVIELKCITPNENVFNQLEKYIKWIKDYICPLYHDKTIIINPIIIAPFGNNTLLTNKKIKYESSNKEKIKVSKEKYISVHKDNDNILFNELT